MADYSNSKPNIVYNYPQAAGKTEPGLAGFSRVESFLTPDRLKNEWLFGIPLTHPYTKQVLTDDMLKNIINRSAARVELENKIDIFPVQRVKRIDFDRTKYLQGFNQVDLSFKNVMSIEEFSIRAANAGTVINQFSPINQQIPPFTDGTVFYDFPKEWIDMGYAARGIIHLTPLQTTFSGTGIVAGSSSGPAAALFAIFSKLQWIPSFFYCKFTCGFQENSVPAPINDLIGCFAALDILSMLGPLHKFSSQSIGIDSISQGVSGPGNQIYALRIEQLNQRIAELTDLLKARFGSKLWMTNF